MTYVAYESLSPSLLALSSLSPYYVHTTIAITIVTTNTITISLLSYELPSPSLLAPLSLSLLCMYMLLSPSLSTLHSPLHHNHHHQYSHHYNHHCITTITIIVPTSTTTTSLPSPSLLSPPQYVCNAFYLLQYKNEKCNTCRLTRRESCPSTRDI